MLLIDFRLSTDTILENSKDRNLPQWQVPIFDFIESWGDKSIKTFEVKTSGSTGKPKVIQHSRAAMIVSAERTCQFFDLSEGNTALLALPLTGVGAKMMLVRSIVKQLQLICVEPSSAPLSAIELKNEIDFAAFTPMQMSMMLDDESAKQKVSRIKKIILGGGEVSMALKQRLGSLPSMIYETYGMTETISHVALKRLNGATAAEDFTVLDGISISQDERGCLLITAPSISPETIRTNDIVELQSSNSFKWIGRYDNMINTGGIKIAADSVERKLNNAIRVPFFIAGTSDEVLGQKITLYVESHDNGNYSESVLKETFETLLERHEKPRLIICTPKFAYTETGKIDRHKTMEQLQ
jgi:O-succinylbenzoic acid--CoA ligase